MKKYLIFISLFISTMLGAQSSPQCGFQPTKAQIEYLNKTQAERSAFSHKSYKSSNAIEIPIVNHIVAYDNGIGGLSLLELDAAIQKLNDFYAQINVKFVACEPTRFIYNNDWYHFNDIDDAAIRSVNDRPGALNIYYFGSINAGAYCGYTNLPSGGEEQDRIMMANNCTINGSTLIHEVGHYFSLYHTHGKSNCSTTDELVDKSNCSFAGDNVCDTPADPNLYFNCETSLIYNCQYIGTLTDANGQPYNPQVSNIMSYSGSCRSVFTQGQFDRVLYSVLNDRNYLTCDENFGACTATVSTFPYTEGFETQAQSWIQGTQDHINWIQNSNSTDSDNTGPSNASQGNSYMYVEATGNYPSNVAHFISPCFDISSLNSPTLTFDYHLYGESMGTLALEISMDDGNSWTELWKQTGNQGNIWLTANVNLSAYTSSTFTLRFKGTTGNSYTSDMAIDNIRIQDNSCQFSAGTPCNDNDTCTINDTYDSNCNCTGTFQDTDNDGVCDADDPCPTITGINCMPLITYCTSVANSGYEFIESVQIGTITNTSGNDNGYGDYTANEPFNIGNFDTPITLTPGFSGQAYNENWKIWIDLNKDGDFEDIGEEVFSGASMGSSPLSGTLKVPPANGTTTMRIAMIWNVAAIPCSMIDYGEVEDYTVNLSTLSNKSVVETNLVEVYPNPAKNYINADIHDIISAGHTQSVNALIYDIKGQLIHTETLNATGVLTINTQHLTEGSYILRLQTDDGRVFTSKFLKL